MRSINGLGSRATGGKCKPSDKQTQGPRGGKLGGWLKIVQKSEDSKQKTFHLELECPCQEVEKGTTRTNYRRETGFATRETFLKRRALNPCNKLVARGLERATLETQLFLLTEEQLFPPHRIYWLQN